MEVLGCEISYVRGAEGDPELLDLDDDLPVADLVDPTGRYVLVEDRLGDLLGHTELGARQSVVELQGPGDLLRRGSSSWPTPSALVRP